MMYPSSLMITPLPAPLWMNCWKYALPAAISVVISTTVSFTTAVTSAYAPLAFGLLDVFTTVCGAAACEAFTDAK